MNLALRWDRLKSLISRRQEVGKILHGNAHGGTGAGKAALHCANGDVESDRGLFVRKTVHIHERENGAGREGKNLHAMLQGIVEFGVVEAVFERGTRVAQPKPILHFLTVHDGHERDEGMAGRAAIIIITFVDNRARQPGAE
jgi:hypothetical protein